MKGTSPTILAAVLLGCAAPIRVSSPPPPAIAPSSPANYSRVETEVLVALNRARTDPTGTAADLDGLVKDYNGALFQRPTQALPIRTVEGAAAAREAVTDVRSEHPVGPLSPVSDLTRAARDLVLDQERTGAVGHAGSDGSSVDTRTRRYGTWQWSLSENIAYAPIASGSDIIQNLLIDDGVPDRGHRRNIYDASAKVVGIACGPHPRFGTMCVIVQAGGFTPK
jgi:uncharacterized protein YkwD